MKSLFTTVKNAPATFLILLGSLGLPMVGSAQVNDFESFVDDTFLLGDAVVQVLAGIAVVIFLFGVFRYTIKAGNSTEGRKDLKDFVVYGLVAIAVFVSFWGILQLLLNSFSVG